MKKLTSETMEQISGGVNVAQCKIVIGMYNGRKVYCAKMFYGVTAQLQLLGHQYTTVHGYTDFGGN